MTPQARSGKTTTEENRTQCRAVLCRTQHKPATDAVARATGLRSTGTGGSAFAGPAGESVKGLRNAATDRETPCDPSVRGATRVRKMQHVKIIGQTETDRKAKE